MESGRVQVLDAVATLVKKLVNVLATFRRPIIPARNVCTADQLLAVDSVVARVVYVVFVALSPVLEPDDVPLPEGAPTIAAVIPHTVPVNVGDAILAFSARLDIVANNPVAQS